MITDLTELRADIARKQQPDLITAEFTQRLATHLNAAGTTGHANKFAAERVRVLDIQAAIREAMDLIGVSQVTITRAVSGEVRIEGSK